MLLAFGFQEAGDGDEVAVKQASLEGVVEAILALKNQNRGFDGMPLGFYRRGLDDCMAEIGAQHLESATWLERLGCRRQPLFVAAY